MNPADVHLRVQEAVRAWGAAPDIEAAAKQLEEARRALPPDLVAQLVDEVAEISAEMMVELLTEERGVDVSAEPVELGGVELLPKQAARLSAWLEDQQRTAEALGIDGDAWIRQMERGFDRFLARARGDEGTPELAEATAKAHQLLGAERETFQPRPEPGVSERAGLAGVLAARDFAKKKK
ncbi:MAG: hypothetical protein RIT81_40965 [Deltaproteobacteria bacterium]